MQNLGVLALTRAKVAQYSQNNCVINNFHKKAFFATLKNLDLALTLLRLGQQFFFHYLENT